MDLESFLRAAKTRFGPYPVDKVSAICHAPAAMGGGSKMTPFQTTLSLYDMLKFYADYFTRSVSSIFGLPRIVRNIEGWEAVVEESLSSFKRECDRIGFVQLANQTQRILDKTTLKHLPVELIEDRRKTVEVLLGELYSAAISKLQLCLFLRVDTERIKWYSDKDLPLFGEKVAQRFRKTTYHIAEAGRCYALERWDACAYHLMVATEEMLRKWARANKFATKGPIDLNDWKGILDAGKQGLDALRQQPKSIRRDKCIQQLAEQLANFGLIKDAFRNHIAHAREKYDERLARNLMNHVEAFSHSLVK